MKDSDSITAPIAMEAEGDQMTATDRRMGKLPAARALMLKSLQILDDKD